MRITKGLIVAGVLGGGLLLLNGCRSTRSDGEEGLAPAVSWQQQPLAIDGSDSDWVKPLRYFDSKHKISYTVSNDSSKVYILMSTKSEPIQQQILQGGLTVWFNNQGEKNEDKAAGISFPTGSTPARSSILTAGRPQLYQNKVAALDNVKGYALYGFGDQGVVQYNDGQPNPEGIEINMDYNEAGELVYEAAVPISALFPRSNGHNFAGKSLAIGFFIEPMPGQENRNGGGGVSIGGGLGFGSFGSGGGLGLSIGSGSLGRIGGSKGYKPTKIWQVVSLAKPNGRINGKPAREQRAFIQ